MFYKYGIKILVWMTVIVIQNSYAQSSSELVRNGINKYLQGNYAEAMRYFDRAITNSNFTETISFVNVKPKGYSLSKDIKASTEFGNNIYTGVSDKNYVETSKKELTNAEEVNSDQVMKNDNIELSRIYLYKGRIYLHLKNYSMALQNFTKAINLNPSYTKYNIGIAIVSKLQDYSEVCKDLKIKVEEGNNSARRIFKYICE
jgi:tetratricopeptide (TPR) repeat protein